jgi:O-antigen biosynthesis protein
LKENELNIIIVNYNVSALLEQCLITVIAACKDISAQITVVDNNSTDNSVRMVQEKFPYVTLIQNKENKGFSAANNQAIKQAKGNYILLLNPDTVIPPDAIYKCISFMNEHTDAGALGVKMLDGKGNFLPESKRGLPTPWVAFCKISGVYKLYKKSAFFNEYYLGILNDDQTHEVPVLAGAFLFIRKSVLDKIGLLDEQFFMYAEDIDLSYRITQAGYKNYYYPEVNITHYKGQSSKQNRDLYIKHFYGSMILFYKKHFKGNTILPAAFVVLWSIKILYCIKKNITSNLG